MASALDSPAKSTRYMTRDELLAEAARLAIPIDDDLETLRNSVKLELNNRWRDENREAIASMNAWVEKHGLPLEKYRMF